MPRARGSRKGGAFTGANPLRYQVELSATRLTTVVDDCGKDTVAQVDDGDIVGDATVSVAQRG